MNRDTICVQGGYTPGNGEPRQIPIIQSTTFKYATSEDMGKLFDLETNGYFYSRLQNPTCDLVAQKICELEGGTAAMLTSSGQAANFFALFNLCQAGDHIVASSTIYGGTFNLISVTMKKMGTSRQDPRHREPDLRHPRPEDPHRREPDLQHPRPEDPHRREPDLQHPRPEDPRRREPDLQHPRPEDPHRK